MIFRQTLTESERLGAINKFIQENNIRTYTDLFFWMSKNISPSILNNCEDSEVQSSIQLMFSHIGNCYDFSNLEYDILTALGYSCNLTFWAEILEDDKIGTTHTFLTINLDDSILWFEMFWDENKGLHKYDSLEKVMIYICNCFELSDAFTLNFYKAKEYHGVTFDDYAREMMQNELIYTYTQTPES